MDKKLLKEEYKRLLTKAIEGRPGGMALMIMLEETDLLQTALLEMIEWWEPGSSAAVVEMLIAEERRRTEQEKAKQRKERVVTNAVKQLRTRLKSVQGAPVVERAHLCRQKKLERYRRSKTKRSSN